MCNAGCVFKSITNRINYMNKKELALAVQKELKLEFFAEAERAVDGVIASIAKGIKKHKTVQLIGFGTFSIAKRAARIGVNPQTGEKLKIKASKTVKFKPGTKLKSSV